MKQVDDSFVENFFGGGTGDPINSPDPNKKPNPDKKEDEDEDPNKNVLTNKNVKVSLGDLMNGDDEDEDDDEDEEGGDDDEDESGKGGGDGDDEDEDEDDNRTILSNKKSKPAKEPQGGISLKAVVDKLIEDDILIGFADEDFEIKTEEDLKELIVANLENKETEAIKTKFNELYNSLPDELKTAMEYVGNGGKDLKTLFKKLSNVAEVQSLDIADKQGQESVIRSYFKKSGTLTDEEIDEQIAEWEDLELLEKKAELYKPKLETLLKKEADEEIKREEKNKEKQKELLKDYFDGVKESIKDGNLNGLSLSKEEQNKIYEGLTENKYKSSISGKPINFLGKFIEDITWNKPDYKALSELTLFALNINEYKKKIEDSVQEKLIADHKLKLRSKGGENNNKNKKSLLRR